jgi:hypothetical protein
MNDRASQLTVASVLAFAILLAPAPASADSGNGPPPAPATPGACPQCSQAPACSGPPSACRQLPRIIRYSYPSGALTVEGTSDRPDRKLRPDEPLAVRVCCINPYRHAVNVKIDQQTFEELYKAPSEVTSQLQPGAQPTKKPAPAPKPPSGTPAAAEQAKPLVKPAPPPLQAQLDDLNVDFDRLLFLEELVPAQRARILQIDDPGRLSTVSKEAVFATAQAVLDPDNLKLRPCSNGVCSPEAMIQLRAELTEDIEGDFADLTAAYKKAKAADDDRAKKVAEKEKAAEQAQLLADHAWRGNRARLIKQADDARKAAAAERAKAEAVKEVTVKIAEDYAKAEKRHEALGASRSQRDLQFASMISVYANLLEPDFGCLLFGPVAATGDEVDITVETPLAPEAANFTLSPEPAKSAGGGAGSKKAAPAKATASQVALIIPVVGRHRPSFSTGIFFSSLVNPTFFKDKNGNTAMNQKDTFTPALGAMVHTPLFSLCCPDASIQLSLGVALKDSVPIYALGPSVIIGRRQRTVITAAIAGGQVNRLSGSDRPGQPVQDTQPKTDKVFRYGFLLGLTYNFGSTPQSSASSSSK